MKILFCKDFTDGYYITGAKNGNLIVTSDTRPDYKTYLGVKRDRNASVYCYQDWANWGASADHTVCVSENDLNNIYEAFLIGDDETLMFYSLKYSL